MNHHFTAAHFIRQNAEHTDLSVPPAILFLTFIIQGGIKKEASGSSLLNCSISVFHIRSGGRGCPLSDLPYKSNTTGVKWNTFGINVEKMCN